MFFPPKISFAFTFLAIFLFTTMLSWNTSPFCLITDHRVEELPDLCLPGPAVCHYCLASFTTTLFILTYLASGRSERLRQREAEVLALSESLKLNSAKLQL